MTPIVFGLPTSGDLPARIARLLGAEMGKLEIRRFPDGDSYVRVDVVGTAIRSRDAILVAALDRPDEKVLPLWFLADNLRDLGIGHVGLICPYLPYMRQDRRFLKGEALTSTYFGRMMSHHVDWMVTVDPHLHRHESLDAIYSIRTEVVHAAPLIAAWVRANITNPLLIGPDEESEQWVASVAQQAAAPYTVLRKTRRGDRDVNIELPDLSRYGSRAPVIIDDIVSTARTMIEAAKHLRARGATPPYCIGVHGIFAGESYADLVAAGVAAVVTCNTVAHPTNRIDVSTALAHAASRIIATDHDSRGSVAASTTAGSDARPWA